VDGVEPFAHDKLKDNLNAVGCVFDPASTFICTPASLSQELALGLAAQAGEGRFAQGRDRSRLQALPPRNRDAVQHDL
jgi:hypothetical protein